MKVKPPSIMFSVDNISLCVFGVHQRSIICWKSVTGFRGLRYADFLWGNCSWVLAPWLWPIAKPFVSSTTGSTVYLAAGDLKLVNTSVINFKSNMGFLKDRKSITVLKKNK